MIKETVLPIICGYDPSLVNEYPILGFVLFSRDIEDPLQLVDLVTAVQKRAIERWQRPVFIAIDQEGGRVSRLKEPFTQFAGMEELGALSNATEAVMEYARVTSKEMRIVGLNMNLAPVLDVRRDPVEEHLRGRTLSASPYVVAQLGSIMIKAMEANHIFTVAKHFPGLGKATHDPHRDKVIIDAPEEELRAVDIFPYSLAIGSGLSGVMTSHAIYPGLDPEKEATRSPSIIGILRKDLGFRGILMTDDLEMGAIKGFSDVLEVGVQALEAGTDVLLISKAGDEAKGLITGIHKALMQGLVDQGQRQGTNLRLTGAMERLKATLKLPDKREVREYFHLPIYL